MPTSRPRPHASPLRRVDSVPRSQAPVPPAASAGATATGKEAVTERNDAAALRLHGETWERAMSGGPRRKPYVHSGG
jgi:hypothetical protein